MAVVAEFRVCNNVSSVLEWISSELPPMAAHALTPCSAFVLLSVNLSLTSYTDSMFLYFLESKLNKNYYHEPTKPCLHPQSHS